MATRNTKEPIIYGFDKTIHRTKLLNVEVDKNGKVVSVWYRCMLLPFDQTIVDDYRANSMNHCYEQNPPPDIEGIALMTKLDPDAGDKQQAATNAAKS
jgi:hypothetical protein